MPRILCPLKVIRLMLKIFPLGKLFTILILLNATGRQSVHVFTTEIVLTSSGTFFLPLNIRSVFLMAMIDGLLAHSTFFLLRTSSSAISNTPLLSLSYFLLPDFCW